MLQTDRTDTGRLIESKMITDMPLTFNRNFQSLLVTVPGSTRPHREHSAVLQLAGLAALRGQRPAAHGEQHADRRARRQPEDRAAAGHHPGGRRARDGQRDDEQLRRRIRPLGRRDHQRHDQVGHQPATRAAASSSATTRRPTPATTSPTRRRRPSSSTPASRWAARSSATSCSSSATTSARSTTTATSSAPRCRRWRCATATSARSRSGIYDPLTGDVNGNDRVAVRQQHHSRRPHQPDRAEAARRSSRCRTSPRAARPEQLSARRRCARRRPTGSTPRSTTR